MLLIQYTLPCPSNAAMIRGMKVNGAHMKAVLDDFSNATDMADYLAKKAFHSVKLTKS